MLRFSWKLFRQELKQRRGRVLLTGVGVAVGVAVVVAVLIIRDSLGASMSESTLGLLGDGVHVAAPAAGGRLAAEQGESLAALPDVNSITGVLLRTLPVQIGGQPYRMQLFGADFLQGAANTFGDGIEIEFENDEVFFMNALDSVMLPQWFAAKAKLTFQDRFEVMTAVGKRELVVRAIYKARKSLSGEATGTPVAIMYSASMQGLLAQEGYVDFYALNADVDSGQLNQAAAKAALPGIKISDADELDAFSRQMLATFSLILLIIAMFSALLSTVLVYNTMSHRVFSLRHDLAVLRCIGLETRGVIQLVLSEGLIVGGFALAAGVGVGVAMGAGALRFVERVVSELYLPVHAERIIVSPTTLALAIGIGLVCILAGTIIPAWRAAQQAAVEQARDAAAPAWSPARVLMLALAAWSLGLLWLPGLAVGQTISFARLGAQFLMGIALLPALLLGARWLLRAYFKQRKATLAQHVAVANLGRDTGRAVSTAGALAVSIAVVIAISVSVRSFADTLENWVKQEVTADIHVTASWPLVGPLSTPLDAPFREQLQSVAGVAAVNIFRMLQIPYGAAGQQIQLLSYDMNLYGERYSFQPDAGDPLACKAQLIAGSAVLATEPFARQFGVKPGDRLRLDSPTGPLDVAVCAVVRFYGSDLGALWLHQPIYAARWNDRLINSFDIYLAADASARQVVAAVESQWGPQYDLYVLDKPEFEQMILGALRSAVYVAYAPALVAGVVAFLHLVVSFLVFANDRRKDMGLLRLIGAEPAWVTRAFLIETTLLSLLGGILGCAMGIAVGWVTTQNVLPHLRGMTIAFSVDWILVGVMFVGSLLVGYLAAAKPARQFAEHGLELEISSIAG